MKPHLVITLLYFFHPFISAAETTGTYELPHSNKDDTYQLATRLAKKWLGSADLKNDVLGLGIDKERKETIKVKAYLNGPHEESLNSEQQKQLLYRIQVFSEEALVLFNELSELNRVCKDSTIHTEQNLPKIQAARKRARQILKLSGKTFIPLQIVESLKAELVTSKKQISGFAKMLEKESDSEEDD